MQQAVLRLKDDSSGDLESLLARYQLQLTRIDADLPIPGSFWGDEEAGLIENRVYARNDTPLHSILHEACHYICMDETRRGHLDTNAGGDYQEENGVCYLQILLANELDSMGRDRMLTDMDAWGYSFRLGSAQAWFEQDAEDARDWLEKYGLIHQQHPTYQLRTGE